MRNETLNYIKKNGMLEPGERVLVGLSGGADSVCLLQILWKLRETLSIELKGLHVHHGLRGREADRDAEFSRNFCRDLGIECKIVYLNVGEEAKRLRISVEEAGRLSRYQALDEEADAWGGAVKIAVAHHGNDNAETILHHLFRGSGLKGLGGIAPVRGRIIRPILWAEKKEILSYLEKNGLFFVEDSTNVDNDYTRNRLRNQILPLITGEINEQAVRHILQAGERVRAADLYFEKIADQWLDRFFCRLEDGGSLPVCRLDEEEGIFREYLARGFLKRCGCPLKDITSTHIQDILSLLSKQTGKVAYLPFGYLAEREYDVLKLRKKAEQLPDMDVSYEFLEKRLQFERFPYRKGEEFPKNQYTKWFDYDKIKDTLSVRGRMPGDYFMLPSGGRKTIKSFMIDEKIPREERARMVLLADGNHILWIIGYRISEYYKITENTKTVLKVQLDGGTSSG